MERKEPKAEIRAVTTEDGDITINMEGTVMDLLILTAAVVARMAIMSHNPSRLFCEALSDLVAGAEQLMREGMAEHE